MKKYVVTLVPQGFHFFELAVTSEVFGLEREGIAANKYDYSMVGLTANVTSQNGVVIKGLQGIELMGKADTIIIPGWYDFKSCPQNLIDELQKADQRRARIVSICTGAFVLGFAGLLEGKKATTHWLHCERFAKTFPNIKVDPNPLYIKSGHIWTSAGTVSGVDLCLELVRNDYGTKVANEFAKRMVTPPHREGGQAQFIDNPLPLGHELQRVLNWVRRNLAEDLSVKRLAEKAKMSERTFARKFSQVTGTTPHNWVLQARVQKGRSLLEQTNLSIEEISEKVGMESSNFRLKFKVRMGTSPIKYRKAFKRA